VSIYEDTARQPELAGLFSFLTKSHKYPTLLVEYLHVLKLTVSNIDVAKAVGCNTTGMSKIAGVVAVLAKHIQEFPLTGKNLYPIVQRITDIKFAAFINPKMSGKIKLSGPNPAGTNRPDKITALIKDIYDMPSRI
jgi:hypothetical protein